MMPPSAASLPRVQRLRFGNRHHARGVQLQDGADDCGSFVLVADWRPLEDQFAAIRRERDIIPKMAAGNGIGLFASGNKTVPQCCTEVTAFFSVF